MESLTEEANALFQSGDFKGAAQKFREAYEAFPDANLKKNEMIASFKSGECTEAIAAGALYLDKGTNVLPKDRSDVQTVEIRCRLQFATDQVALKRFDRAEAELVKIEALGPAAEDRDAIAEVRSEIEKARNPSVATPDPEPDTGSEIVDPGVEVSDSKPEWALWVGVTAIAAGVLTPTIWQLIESHQFAEIADLAAVTVDNCSYTSSLFGGTWSAPCGASLATVQTIKDFDENGQSDRLENIQKDSNTRIAAVWIAGGVVAAGGVGLLVYYLVADSSESNDGVTDLQIVPEISHDRAGVQFQLRF